MADTLTLPQTGTYAIDPVHSSINFVARHLVGSKVRGRFTEFAGSITVAEPAEASRVEVVVQTASVDTGNEQRDGHLRSGDFLELERYPTLRFVSTALAHADGDEWTLTGDLTVKDVTRQVAFQLEYLGSGPGMAPGVDVIAFSASTDMDRRDFGVTFSAALDNGGLVVGNKVHIEIEVEASLQS